MNGFTGRLFGPGLAGTGVAVEGRWRHGRLEFRWAGGSMEVRVPPLITASGFNREHLRVSWVAPEGEFQFFVDGGAAGQGFAIDAPPEVARAIGQAGGLQRRLERRFQVAAVLLIGLPLALLALFLLFSDAIADWVVDRIPVEEEARLGELVLTQTRAQMQLRDSGPAVDALRSIGGRLIPDSRQTYRWFLADRPEVNAFAAPGGVVVVFSGLLAAADRPEEVAGVLAHEVAHAELRHGLRGLVKGAGLRLLLAFALGDWSDSLAGDLAAQLTQLRFSRDAEREADADGLRRMVAARMDPSAMVSFFEKLAAQPTEAALPAWLSTHPDTGERIAELKQQLARLNGDWQPLDIEWQDLRTGAHF